MLDRWFKTNDSQVWSLTTFHEASTHLTLNPLSLPTGCIWIKISWSLRSWFISTVTRVWRTSTVWLRSCDDSSWWRIWWTRSRFVLPGDQRQWNPEPAVFSLASFIWFGAPDLLSGWRLENKSCLDVFHEAGEQFMLNLIKRVFWRSRLELGL